MTSLFPNWRLNFPYFSGARARLFLLCHVALRALKQLAIGRARGAVGYSKSVPEFTLEKRSFNLHSSQSCGNSII